MRHYLIYNLCSSISNLTIGKKKSILWGNEIKIWLVNVMLWNFNNVPPICNVILYMKAGEQPYACVYVFLYVCVYVFMYLCVVHACMYDCIYVCMYICVVHACMSVFLYVCVYVCMCGACMYVCMYDCIYMCVCIYVGDTRPDLSKVGNRVSAT